MQKQRSPCSGVSLQSDNDEDERKNKKKEKKMTFKKKKNYMLNVVQNHVAHTCMTFNCGFHNGIRGVSGFNA
jgi:hypothetical protein